MEDAPRTEYDRLTYKVVNRTRDEEREWTSELDVLFEQALVLAGDSPDPFGDPAIIKVLDLVHTHHNSFVQALEWSSKPRSRVDARKLFDDVYMALATIHNASLKNPTQRVKLDAIRGNRNVYKSTSPGVRVLVRNDAESALQLLSGMTTQSEVGKYATSFTLPRGGYDANSFGQGFVIVFGDHDVEENPRDKAASLSFKGSQRIPSHSLVALHGLSVKPLPDFFQNVEYYPNGKRNPYRDPQLIAKMQEHDVTFDNNIFLNPWLDEQDTFGKYEE